MNLARQIRKAFFDGIESGKRAKEGEVRRPDMRRNEDGLRAGLQRDLQQIAAVQSENGTPIRMDVPDQLQPARKRIRSVETWQQDHIVHLARFAVSLIDRADFTTDDEAGRFRSAAGIHRQAQIVLEGIEPLFGRHERLAQRLPPCRMGKVARADQAKTLVASPKIQMRRITGLACGARIMRVNVQIRQVHGVILRKRTQRGVETSSSCRRAQSASYPMPPPNRGRGRRQRGRNRSRCRRSKRRIAHFAGGLPDSLFQ